MTWNELRYMLEKQHVPLHYDIHICETYDNSQWDKSGLFETGHDVYTRVSDIVIDEKKRRITLCN
jgi:hypothetical protein